MQELTYRQRPEVSRSELLLLTTPHLFFREKERNTEHKSHFSIGTGVDIALAYGLNYLKDNTMVLEEQPTGVLFKIPQFLIDSELDFIEENILFARQELNIQPNWKDKTILDAVVSKTEWYYDVLKEAQGKTLVTEDELRIVIKIFHSIRNNPYTGIFFKKTDDVIILNHVDIYFNYKGIGCKAELDHVIINLRDRTIQPIDYKTTAKPTRSFPKTVKERRYDIQAACYTLALEYLVNGQAECPKIKIDLSNFRILPFIFLVETTIEEDIGMAPMPFQCDNNTLRAGLYGVLPSNRHFVAGPSPSKVFQVYPLIPGFDTLIEELIYQRSKPNRELFYTKQEDEELQWQGTVALSVW